MVLEMNAVIQSANALIGLIKAGYSVRNANEIATAVFDIMAKLTVAQAAVLASQEKQATLAQEKGELEKEIVELKNWDRERERYQLTEIITGVFVYSLKPGMENGEPPHNLCANCFAQREKSILQATSPGVFTYRCPRCQNEFHVRNRPTSAPIEGV